MLVGRGRFRLFGEDTPHIGTRVHPTNLLDADTTRLDARPGSMLFSAASGISSMASQPSAGVRPGQRTTDCEDNLETRIFVVISFRIPAMFDLPAFWILKFRISAVLHLELLGCQKCDSPVACGRNLLLSCDFQDLSLGIACAARALTRMRVLRT
jgi:hypothetical protein